MPARKDQPVVVLTGASSGIGAALAVEMARVRGARIGLVARRAEMLEDVARRVRDAGGEALPLPCDVVDAAEVAEAVRKTEGAFGALDLAIANAGIGGMGSLRKTDAAAVAGMMRVNFEGASNLFFAALPGMMERGRGQIVGVSSLAGFRGLPASGPYCASKAALSTLMESMRLELRGRGVTVTAVHPGFVQTAMTEKNRFPMPFLWPLDKAARFVERGIRTRKREINFPWPLWLAAKFGRMVPGWVWDRVMGGRGGGGKPGAS
jgi:short-subunit dehydrogenase